MTEQYIHFSLDRSFQKLRKDIPIVDGETYRVYVEFNMDSQLWEIMLIK